MFFCFQKSARHLHKTADTSIECLMAKMLVSMCLESNSKKSALLGILVATVLFDTALFIVFHSVETFLFDIFRLSKFHQFDISRVLTSFIGIYFPSVKGDIDNI